MSTSIRSRRFALAAAVVVGLSACGSTASTSSSSPDTTVTTGATAAAPPVIHVAGGGASTPATPSAAGDAAVSAESADTSKMSFAAYFTYVYGGDPIDLTAPAASWMFEAGATPGTDEILQLARAFGIDGDVREVPADQGGGWAVGSEDYSQPSVNVGSDATLGWWYNAGYDESAVPTCVLVDPAIDVVPDAGTGTADTTAETTAESTAETVEPADSTAAESPIAEAPCEPQAPPVDVPTADEAETMATETMTSLGLDPASYELETYADEWSASVTAFLVLDGMRTPMSFNIGYGESGAITWAGGFLATPLRGADYPRIGVEAAVQRLNDQSTGWFADGPITARGGDEVTSGPAVEPAVEPAVDPATDVVVEPTKDDAAPTETITPPEMAGAIEPVAPDESFVQPEVEPVTVTLTDPVPSLEMLWDVDNTVWLLPGYAFDGGDNGTFSVMAVEDQYLDIPTPSEAPVDTAPAPSTTPPSDGGSTCAPSSTDDIPADASASATSPDGSGLVGLCEADASALAESIGFTMRVVRIDGVEQAVTMDLVDTRFNVAVEGGVVTEVVSIG